jgi:hypothetical protein
MTSSRILSFVTLLLAAALFALAPLASAELIQTDELVPEGQAKTEREKLRAFLDRATVTERLKALGVQDGFLKPRVDSLTDEEVQMLAARIDALPAGGAMSDYQLLIVILLVAILVAIVA